MAGELAKMELSEPKLALFMSLLDIVERKKRLWHEDKDFEINTRKEMIRAWEWFGKKVLEMSKEEGFEFTD
jgi:hypothetical protein